MLDGVDIAKKVVDAERPQYTLRVMHGRVGKHEFAPRQPIQTGAQHGLGNQYAMQVGKLVRVPQKMRRIGVVVPDQSEYRRAIAPPVGVPQRTSFCLVEVQMRLHIFGHGAVDARKYMHRGIMQRVVEIEYPGAVVMHSHAQRLLINVPTPSLVRISSKSACSTRPSMM